MIHLPILKPIALATMLATGAAGTTVATEALSSPAAESASEAAPPTSVRVKGNETARAIRELEPGERGRAMRELKRSPRASIAAAAREARRAEVQEEVESEPNEQVARRRHGNRPAHAGQKGMAHRQR